MWVSNRIIPPSDDLHLHDVRGGHRLRGSFDAEESRSQSTPPWVASEIPDAGNGCRVSVCVCVCAYWFIVVTVVCCYSLSLVGVVVAPVVVVIANNIVNIVNIAHNIANIAQLRHPRNNIINVISYLLHS